MVGLAGVLTLISANIKVICDTAGVARKLLCLCVCVFVLHSCMHANRSLTNCRLPFNSANCSSLFCLTWKKNNFRYQKPKFPPFTSVRLFFFFAGSVMNNAIVWGLCFMWLWRLLYWSVTSCVVVIFMYWSFPEMFEFIVSGLTAGRFVSLKMIRSY